MVASARGRPASRLDVSCPEVVAFLNPKKAVAVQIAGLSAWKADEKGLGGRLNKENRKHVSANFMGGRRR